MQVSPDGTRFIHGLVEHGGVDYCVSGKLLFGGPNNLNNVSGYRRWKCC